MPDLKLAPPPVDLTGWMKDLLSGVNVDWQDTRTHRLNPQEHIPLRIWEAHQRLFGPNARITGPIGGGLLAGTPMRSDDIAMLLRPRASVGGDINLPMDPKEKLALRLAKAQQKK